jgi:hypothetical protein
MDLYVGLPWVGGGSPGNPYRFNWSGIGFQSAASMILAGVTCFDPSTGVLDSNLKSGAIERLNTLQCLSNVQNGGIGVGHYVLDESFRSGITTFIAPIWPLGFSLTELYSNTLSLHDLMILNTGQPSNDLQSIQAVQDLSDALVDSERWGHYRNIFDLTGETPSTVPGLTSGMGDSEAAVMDNVDAYYYSSGKELLAENIYSLIACREVLTALSKLGVGNG